ncbi:MAG: ABC transporter substrate-binding protein [Myxococcota bacterium]
MRRLHPLFVPAVVVTLAIEVLIASTARSAEPESGHSSAPGAATVAERAPASTPIRVATLLPWAGDAVGLAGESAVLVAGVRRSLHAPLPDGLIDLGNPHAPSLERLAEARPDLVVADAAIHARLAAPIGKLGPRVLLLETATVEQTLDALAQLSQALGGAPALDARIAATRSRITALSGRTRASLVALFGAPGTFYVMTERAWLGDLAKTLGFELAIAGGGDERFPGLVAVSDEVMATARPDLVLLVAHGDPRKIRADLERRTAGGGAWAGLSKARLGIHVLDPDLFSANPGLGIVEAAETLVELSSGTTTGRNR